MDSIATVFIKHNQCKNMHIVDKTDRSSTSLYKDNLVWFNKDINYTFIRKYVHFAYVILTWLSSTYLCCRARKLYQSKISQNLYGKKSCITRNPYHTLGQKTHITTFGALGGLAFDCSVVFYINMSVQLVISRCLVTSANPQQCL